MIPVVRSNSALKILLDARKLGDGGIGIYIQNLIDGILVESKKGLPIELTVIVSSELNSEQERLINLWGNKISVVSDRARKYSVDEYLFMSRRLRSVIKHADLFHSPHYTLPREFGRSRFGRQSIPSIVTIHDAIHLTAPENLTQKMIGGMLIRSAVKRADHIVTVSAASLSRLSRLFPGVAISVISNALSKGIGIKPFSEVQRVVDNFKLIQPYVMFVGSDRPHKGFKEMVESLSRVKEHSPMLVVVGKRFSREVKNYAAKKLGEKRVRFLDEVSQQDLAALYNGTRAVLVPSRIEGFGLVALEALAAGAPLVCTPENSLKEVAGSCAWYAEDFSVSAFSEAIEKCLSEKELAEDKAAGGIVLSREFSCERSAAEHLKVYLGVLPDKRANDFYPSGELLSYSSTYSEGLEGEPFDIQVSKNEPAKGNEEDSKFTNFTPKSPANSPADFF